MGVLNVTPDSFSDGGRYIDVHSAAARALQMIGEGADIIDIGGESTRPGSERVSGDEEKKRILPVIEKILTQKPDAVLSVDTCKADVASEALDNGALIINDVSALGFDERMADTVHTYGASVVLMHMKGEPKTMQDNPRYDDVTREVRNYLHDRITFAGKHGIKQILIDPGIGFGKRLEDNLELLRSLRELTRLDCPVVIGASRKSFIGKILNKPVDQRLEGSLAAAVIGIFNGASIVRVHDVNATKEAAAITHAVMLGSGYTQEKVWIS